MCKPLSICQRRHTPSTKSVKHAHLWPKPCTRLGDFGMEVCEAVERRGFKLQSNQKLSSGLIFKLGKSSAPWRPSVQAPQKSWQPQGHPAAGCAPEARSSTWPRPGPFHTGSVTAKATFQPASCLTHWGANFLGAGKDSCKHGGHTSRDETKKLTSCSVVLAILNK